MQILFDFSANRGSTLHGGCCEGYLGDRERLATFLAIFLSILTRNVVSNIKDRGRIFRLHQTFDVV